jgi:glucose/arabinose dehydrogenase
MSAKEDLLTNCDAPRSLAPTHRLLSVSVLLLAFAVSFPMAVAETNNVSNIGLKLVTEGMGAPMALAAIPDGSGRLLLAEQSGVIHVLDQNGKRAEQLFLDLRPQMVAINKGMEERGLLGMALHPQFKSNRKFYAVYSAPRRTNAPPKWDHTERLSEFKAAGTSRRRTLLPSA